MRANCKHLDTHILAPICKTNIETGPSYFINNAALSGNNCCYPTLGSTPRGTTVGSGREMGELEDSSDEDADLVEGCDEGSSGDEEDSVDE